MALEEGASTRRVSYDRLFFDQQAEGSLASARVVLPILFEYYKPKSVVDVGCGRGPWLKAAAECGVQDLLGVDGDYVERDTLLILVELQHLHLNLGERINILRRFDLAISVEVAEHLPFYRAETFVADLVGLSDLVLFSAALPYQGGTEHINEQWLEFWAIFFAATLMFRAISFVAGFRAMRMSSFGTAKIWSSFAERILRIGCSRQRRSLQIGLFPSPIR